MPSAKRGEEVEDCARPGLCRKDAIGDVSESEAICVGERDADVDPVESQALTWLTGLCGPNHSRALFACPPSYIGTSLLPNCEKETSFI